MTAALLLAAGLTFTIGVIHSWLGEIKLIGPLLAPESRSGILERSRFARNVLRLAWHVTTIVWWGMAAIVAGTALAAPDQRMSLTLLIFAATQIITGFIVLVMGRGRHHAWPLFLAAGLLALWPVIG